MEAESEPKRARFGLQVVGVGVNKTSIILEISGKSKNWKKEAKQGAGRAFVVRCTLTVSMISDLRRRRL